MPRERLNAQRTNTKDTNQSEEADQDWKAFRKAGIGSLCGWVICSHKYIDFSLILLALNPCLSFLSQVALRLTNG